MELILTSGSHRKALMLCACHSFAGCVLHAGGVLRDAAIQNQSAASMREILSSKVVAIQQMQTCLWAACTRETVLFSSTAALLGPPGQANYAAANAAMNAWSQSQQASGAIPGIIIVFNSIQPHSLL